MSIRFVGAIGMLVSIITTTYNRAHYIPRLIECYNQQDYLFEREWIILDDGTEKVGHLFSSVETARYLSIETKLPMGAKLNLLNKEAKGDIIIVMDDDDYYPPWRISQVVKAFQENPSIELAGSSKVYMYSTDLQTIYCAGPYHSHHALNCTLAYRRSYLEKHAYDDNEICAVEKVFLDNFTKPIIQLETTILHMIHSSNTYKNKMGIGLMKKTDLTLQDFIHDSELCAAFTK